MRRIPLTGRTFGRLTVEWERGKYAQCLCICGRRALRVLRSNLLAGYTQSCGCLQRERTAIARRSHGLSGKPIYNTWRAMKARCTNPSNENYQYYGAKGVRVCPQWQKFSGFLADMGGSYIEGYTIDRRDANGNYEPGNCRWIPHAQNAGRGKRGSTT